MKVVALVVIFLVIWRWTCASPLPCGGESCDPSKETHSVHHCKHVKTFEHYKDTVRSKRDFGLKNISYAVKRAAINVGKRLHLITKREIDTASENQTSDRSNSFNPSPISTATANSAEDSLIPENDENPTQLGNRVERIGPVPRLPTSYEWNKVFGEHRPRRRRQTLDNEKNETINYSVQNNTDAVQENFQAHNFKRQTANSKNDTQNERYQNITIIGKSLTNKRQTPLDHHNNPKESHNATRVVRQVSSDHQNHTGETQNTTRVVRQTAVDHQNHAEETQNTTRVLRQATVEHQNNAENTQNITRVLRQATVEHQNHTGKTQNTTKVVRETADNHQNHTGETQNTTRVVRQTAVNNQNHAKEILDHHNNSKESHNATRVVRQVSSDHQNHTGETQNTTRVTRQTAVDHQNHAEETQNTTRVLRQATVEHQNHTGETQNTTRVLRQATVEHQNHTGETQNTTRVVRQTAVDHQNHAEETQNTTRNLRQATVEHQNHTGETQNTTRVVRQTAVDHQNHAEETQNTTRVLRQATVLHQNHTGETQNTTRVVRQTAVDHQNHAEETQNTTRVLRQATVEHQNHTGETQNTTRVVRQTAVDHQNHAEETQNTTRVLRQATVEHQNHTGETQNTTRVVRQTAVDHQNHAEETQNTTRVLRQATVEHQNHTGETQNTTRVVRQTAVDHQNHAEETQNTTRVLRQATVEHQNHTGETQNTTRVVRQTAVNHQNHAEETQNTTRVLRQATVEHQNHTGETQNITRVIRQTAVNHQSHAEETQNTTRVLRQATIEHQNHTGKTQNTTKVVRQVATDHQNHTGETQNTTRVLRQATVKHQNHTGKTQNSTKVVRQVAVDHQNHTGEIQKYTTRVQRQAVRHDRENNIDGSQNTTRLVRQHNRTIDSQASQNITIIKRRIFSDDVTDETPDLAGIRTPFNVQDNTPNVTTVEKRIFKLSNDTLDLPRIDKQVIYDPWRHEIVTLIVHNYTRDGQNTSGDVTQPFNIENSTQNETRVKREKSSDHNNHTNIQGPEVTDQNTTKVKRQAHNYTEHFSNHTRTQTPLEHPEHIPTSRDSMGAVQQAPSEPYNLRQDIQNTTRAVRQVPYSSQNYTLGTPFEHPEHIPTSRDSMGAVQQAPSEPYNLRQDIQNTTRAVRQVPYSSQNYTLETPFEHPEHIPTSRDSMGAVQQAPSEPYNLRQDIQNTTRVTKQAPVYQNHTANNSTRVVRQAFINDTHNIQNTTNNEQQTSLQHQNDTEMTQNVTRLVREASENNTAAQNKTGTGIQNNNQKLIRLGRQTVPDYKDHIQKTHNIFRFARQIFDDHKFDTQETQNVTKVKRQTDNNNFSAEPNNATINEEASNIGNNSREVQKPTIMKREVHDTVIMIRKLTDITNDSIDDAKFQEDKDLLDSTDLKNFRTKINGFDPKCMTQIFVNIPKRNRSWNLEPKNAAYEEYNATEPEITNKIKRQITDSSKGGGLAVDPPKNIKKLFTRKQKQQQPTASPKEAKELRQEVTTKPENGSLVDNVRIQIQRFYEKDYGERRVKRDAQKEIRSEEKKHDLQDDGQLSGDGTRTRKNAELPKNITIQIQKYTQYRFNKKKRDTENTTFNNNKTLLNDDQPVKVERYIDESQENLATNIPNLNSTGTSNNTREKRHSVCDCIDINELIDNEVYERNRRNDNATVPSTDSIDNSTSLHNATHPESLRADGDQIMNFRPRQRRSATLKKKDVATSYPTDDVNISENNETVPYTVDVSSNASHPVLPKQRRAALPLRDGGVIAYQIVRNPFIARESIPAENAVKNSPLSYMRMNTIGYSRTATPSVRRKRRSLIIKKKEVDVSPDELSRTINVNTSAKNPIVPYTESGDNSTVLNTSLSEMSLRNATNISEEKERIADNTSGKIGTSDQEDISLTRTVLLPEPNITTPYPGLSGNSTSQAEVLPQIRTDMPVNPVVNISSKQRRSSPDEIPLTIANYTSERNATVAHTESAENSQNASAITKRDDRHSHIMKIPRKHRRSAKITKEDDYTTSEEVPEPYFQFGENGTNQLPPIKFIRTPLLISFSAATDKNNTEDSAVRFYDVSTENMKTSTVTEKSSINNDYNKYEFVPDDSSDVGGGFVEKYEDIIMSDDLESEEEFNEVEVVNEKSSRRVERVTCACATFPPDSITEDKNPTLSENFVYVPSGLKKSEKELLCTRNCTGMPKDDPRYKQEVYCAHAKADEKFKKMFPQGQLNYPDASDVIFCQIFPSEAEPTLQFILSWLNVVLLDVVVCLTGLGIVCIYLICFVTFRKRDNGPIYTPAAYNIK